MALQGDLVKLNSYGVSTFDQNKVGVVLSHARAGSGKRKYKLLINGRKREQFFSENDFEVIAPRWK